VLALTGLFPANVADVHALAWQASMILSGGGSAHRETSPVKPRVTMSLSS
jgi:hypothetical protein